MINRKAIFLQLLQSLVGNDFLNFLAGLLVLFEDTSICMVGIGSQKIHQPVL